MAALEEHITFPNMVQREPLARLAEIGPERLRLMAEAGITVQVLSGPGSYPPAGGPAFALAKDLRTVE